MNASLFNACSAYLRAQDTMPAARRSRQPRAVTISREAGAGAVTVGRLVAANLEAREKTEPEPWAVFDRNIVEKVIEDHGLEKSVGQYMPEDVTSGIQDTIEELLGVHPSSWSLSHHISHTVLKLASMGNVVLVGRGANFITAHLKHVLHVRLVSPVEQRIKHIESFHKMSHADAVAFVKKTDGARERYIHQHFKASVADPLGYHLTINTGSVSYEESARIIGDAALQMPH